MFPEIDKLKGSILKTLSKNKPFQVIDIDDYGIKILVHSSHKNRSIPLQQLQKAFTYLQENKEISQRKIDDSIARYNSSYTLAILAKITKASFF